MVRFNLEIFVRGVMAIAFAFALSMCVTSNATAVENGIAQTPAYSWSAQIYVDQVYACSGELIALQWVVTASHCFNYESGSSIADQTSVVLPSGTYSVDVVESTLPTTALPLAPDLSMVHITTAASGASPIPIATLEQENSFRKKGVTFFGWGQGEYQPASLNLGKTENGMWTLNANCPTVAASWYVDCFTHHSAYLGVVEHGDSGGAWVGWSNGQWVMLATETGPSIYADVTEYGTSVVRMSSWIAQVEANDAPTSSTPAPPTSTQPPSASPNGAVSVSWGNNPAPYGNWMNITFSNFPSGTVSWSCVEGGTDYGSYYTTLTSSVETLTTNTCYDATPGNTDYVVANGISSNVIGADSAPAPPTSAPPPPPPSSASVSVSWGGNQAPYGNWMNITFSNFPTGSVSWSCVEGGTNYGPYHTTLTSSNETLTTKTCYDATPGNSDYVVANGISSNVIGAD